VTAATDGVLRVRIGSVDLEGRGALSPGDEALAAIRAERVAVLDDEATTDGLALVRGSVSQVIFEGDRLVYAVHVPALDGATLFAFDHGAPEAGMHRAGERVALRWRPADLMIFPP
jgi:putative spermidine/putrescine transport system ATP-binding protein